MAITKNNISVSIKDFIGLCLFLISLGISIGGFIKVLNDFNKLESKIDKVSEDITSIKETSARLDGVVSELKKK